MAKSARNRQVRRPRVSNAMQSASTYAEWLQAAREADQASGAVDWREDDESPHLASGLLRADMDRLRVLRSSGKPLEIQEVLQESLYRHQGDIANPINYRVALAGTKRVIDEYLDEVETTLRYLAAQDFPELPSGAKLAAMQMAATNLGEPALLLSGGASMGFFHLGVTKALLEQGLLPEVISGASMGALIGGGICSRTDAELAEMFANLEAMYRFGIRFHRPTEIWRHRSLLDGKQMLHCAQENIGNETFFEMWQRTGRKFSVSVSPNRARQKPRILSFQTSPNVLVARGVLASCAIPGVFPPVTLHSRSGTGTSRPYLPTELWVDGTFQGDLPMKRLGRLFNVNHFIVSQTNPHAGPFLASRSGRGPMSLLADLGLSTARAQTAQVLKVLQSRIVSPGVQNVMEHARLLAEQEYRGDVNIHPPVSPWMYRRILSNPSVDDLKRYIQLGERATWPQIALIRNQVRIRRTLKECIETVGKRGKKTA